MAGKLNILSLHRMGPPWSRREAVRELEYMMPTYAAEHNCLVHDAALPLPDYVKQIQFHAIVLGPTFLCARYYPDLHRRMQLDYAWIRNADAVKIALPQDDYDCAGILDRWMVDWNVDRVYTVCPEHWDVLYPTYSKSGRIKLGYTGYVSPRWVADWAEPKPHAARAIDVSYRASKLPANFGSVGELKSRIGEKFLAALPATADLKVDISTNPKDLIPGSAWHDFLENSRFCLTTPSGSSLLDPEGAFRERVVRYTSLHPTAEFSEVAENCFKGEDRKYVFIAISPRNIEAALAGTVQLATPGSYSGLMQPMEHYIPLEPDCSNITTVLRMMKDQSLVSRIATSCKELVLQTPQLQFVNHVREMVELVHTVVERRKVAGSPPEQMDEAMRRYAAEMPASAARHWRWQKMLGLLRSTAKRLGARRIKRLLTAARAV